MSSVLAVTEAIIKNIFLANYLTKITIHTACKPTHKSNVLASLHFTWHDNFPRSLPL